MPGESETLGQGEPRESAPKDIRHLDLANCDLTSVPAEVRAMTGLESLSFCELRPVPIAQGRWRLTRTNNRGAPNRMVSLDAPGRRQYLRVNPSGQWRSVFADLQNLRALWVSGVGPKRDEYCWIDNLAPLAGLTNLEVLVIAGSQVADLAPLRGLKKLRVLNISRTKVASLEPLRDLTQLECLSASAIPASNFIPLEYLPGLRDLDLADTQFRSLELLEEMSGLERLNISGTAVTSLDGLTLKPTLRKIYLGGTRIRSLARLTPMRDFDWLDLGAKCSDLAPFVPMLRAGVVLEDRDKLVVEEVNEAGVPQLFAPRERPHLYLEPSALIEPPPEVFAQGRKAVLSYFQQKDEQGVDYLYEAKVLIVGEGGAGKTSLVRRLYEPDKPLPTEGETTKGIAIHQNGFKLPDGRVFRLNVWDFGGQEIYHATHQFFLTRRSLYILLDDTRKDHKTVHDEGLKYWLEVVDLLSDHSPLLIFQNEKGGRSKAIDLDGIKARFPNVVELHRGNLEYRSSVDALRRAVEYFVQRLPHVGEQLPSRWVAIRRDIEALAVQQPHITQAAYFEIYESHLPGDRHKALLLSRYLHDLGVFLHFQDDPLLSRTVILRNNWATEAVFKMLDDEAVKSSLGHFTMEDCERVWRGGEYAEMHPELLALMEKFELCYRLPDLKPDTWLAPQMLSPSKPAQLTDWSQPGDLVLRYRYQFMPKGLVSRLMVRLQRFVSQPELGWGAGALFERGETQVLVEIGARAGNMDMRARGPERKELLSVIASDLDALNASFHGLAQQVRVLVPCTCTRCRELTEPEYFDQSRLLQRKRDGRLRIECPASYEEVAVHELIDGIRIEHPPRWAMPQEAASERAETRTIKVFLASSSELKDDRDAFDLYFRQQNDRLQRRGIYLQIDRWETFLGAMSETRLQDEYNRVLRSCDIFVSLFFTKSGQYTQEEFKVAHQHFLQTGKPLIYTFFRTEKIALRLSSRKDVESLWNFQEQLQALGHFYTDYETTEELISLFRDQLDKILET